MTVLWSLITYYRSQKKYMKKFAGTVWSLNTSPHARLNCSQRATPTSRKQKRASQRRLRGWPSVGCWREADGPSALGQKFWSRLHWLGYFCQFVVGQVVSTDPEGTIFVAPLLFFVNLVVFFGVNPTPRNGLEILVGETSWSRWAQRKVGVGCFKCVAFSICFHQPSNSQLSNEKKVWLFRIYRRLYYPVMGGLQ